MSLLINEIFYSIQGESLSTGRPCVFIRLSGCNLRCSYCDTTYAFNDGYEFEIENIENEIAKYKCSLVEITGGEPLLKKETPGLISHLLSKGYEVMLETNGSLDVGYVNAECIKIMDVKCPSSNESEKNRFENLSLLTEKDQIKFVIGDRNDYEYAIKTIKRTPAYFFENHILFSPVHGIMSPKKLAEWILSDHLKVRLHLQIHKIIWPDVERGV